MLLGSELGSAGAQVVVVTVGQRIHPKECFEQAMPAGVWVICDTWWILSLAMTHVQVKHISEFCCNGNEVLRWE